MFAQLQSFAKEAAATAAAEAARLSAEAQKRADDLVSELVQAAGALDTDTVHCMDFPDGPLGFDLEGPRVAVVEPGGLAEQLGVQVGDRLSAVEGEVIPAPPSTDTLEEGEQRMKRMIRKRIKDKPRPVKLTFIRKQSQSEVPSSEQQAPDAENAASMACASDADFVDGDLGVKETVEFAKDNTAGGWEDDDFWEGSGAQEETQVELTLEDEKAPAAIDPTPGDQPLLRTDVSFDVSPIASPRNLAVNAKPSMIETSLPEPAIEHVGISTTSSEKALENLQRLHDDLTKRYNDLQTEHNATKSTLAQVKKEQSAAVESSEAALKSANLAATEKTLAQVRADFDKFRAEAKQQHDAAELELKLATERLATATADNRHQQELAEANILEAQSQREDLSRQLEELQAEHDTAKLVLAKLKDDSANAAGPQRRIDPADGLQRTLEELKAFYEGTYSPQEVDEYWVECTPVQRECGIGVEGIALEEANSRATVAEKALEELRASYDKTRLANAQQISKLKESVQQQQAATAEATDSKCRLDAKVVELMKSVEARTAKEVEMEAKLVEQNVAMEALASKEIELRETLRRREADLEAKLTDQMKLMEVQAAKEASLEAKLAELNKALKGLAGREAELKAKLEGQSSGRAAKETELNAKLAERSKAIEAYAKKESDVAANVAELSGMLGIQATKTTGVEVQLIRQKTAVEMLIAKESDLLESFAIKELEIKKEHSDKEAELQAMLTEKEQAHAQIQADLEGQLAELGQRLKGDASELNERITTQTAAATALEVQLAEQTQAVEALVAKEAALQAELANKSQVIEAMTEKEAEMKESFNSKEAKFVATLADKELSYARKQADLDQQSEAMKQRDNRGNAAHVFLENRVQTLQEQLKKKEEEKAQSDTLREVEKGTLDAMSTEIQNLQVRCRAQEEQIAAQEEQILVMAPLQVDLKDAREKLELSTIQMRETEACHKQSMEKAEKAKELALQQRSALENDLAELRAGVERGTETSELKAKLSHAQEEIESWQQRFEVLSRTLRQQLTTQQERAASELEEQKLDFQRRYEALQTQLEGLPVEAVTIGKDEDGTKPEESPPEDAGGEQISALYERIAFLENRCKTMQQKVDARPIVYQSPQGAANNPLGLEGGGVGQTASGRAAWEPWFKDVAAPLARRFNWSQGWEQRILNIAAPICGLIERPLRSFTERLLKRDAWLLMFYAHLLMLYLIVASSLRNVTPDSNSPKDYVEQQFAKAAGAIESGG